MIDPLGLRVGGAAAPVGVSTSFPRIGAPTVYGAQRPVLIPWYLAPEPDIQNYPIEFFTPFWEDRAGVKNADGELLACKIDNRDRCREIVSKIRDLIYRVKGVDGLNRGLLERYTTQLRDPGNLYRNNRKSWDDHNGAIQALVNSLNSLIRQAGRFGCYISRQYLDWAYVVPPNIPMR